MSSTPPRTTAHTPLVMAATALGLGALGLALLFAPTETATALGWGGGEGAAMGSAAAPGALPVATPSVAAGGFLALAVLNWMGRGAIYGGIYGRPIVLANLTFALTAGLALFNHQTGSGSTSPLGWIPVAILAVVGVAFGRMLLGRGGGA